MKIVIFLLDNSKIELFDCSEEDVKRLTSQFNNRHLMHADNVYIIQNKLRHSLFMTAKGKNETLLNRLCLAYDLPIIHAA